MHIAWKIYFWIYVVLTAIGLMYIASEYAPLILTDLMSLIIEIIALVGLFSFVFGKQILPAKFWTVFFYILIVILIDNMISIFILPGGILGQLIPLEPSKINAELSPAETLFSTILAAPTYYAIFKISKS